MDVQPIRRIPRTISARQMPSAKSIELGAFSESDSPLDVHVVCDNY
jgi:hypothetical protein